MSGSRSPRARLWLLPVLLLLIVVLVVWRALAPSTVMLPVVNLGGEVVELELYGDGLAQPVATGPLVPSQRAALALAVKRDGELRLRALSARVSIDSQLLARAAQLHERPLQLEVRDGSRFTLVPAPQ